MIPKIMTSQGSDEICCLTDLDDLSLSEIEQVSVKRSFEKDEIVSLEGDPCLGLIIIESGWLSTQQISPQGRKQVLGLAGPGEMLNIISLFSGNVNLVTLKAVEKSTIWVIQREVLLGLIAKYPSLCSAIIKNMAKWGAHLLDLVDELALRKVEGRLAHLLLVHSIDGMIQMKPWFTEAELAACIGTTSVVVSRLMNEMEKRGEIKLDNHKIYILDRKKVEEVAYLRWK